MILDTCALLWLAQGSGKLSRDTLRKIQGAPALYISAITAFEIAIKHRVGKLALPAAPDEWLTTVLEQHGLAVLPLDASICLRAAVLPEIHRDPCDRFIIASALLMRLPVVTADPRFREYKVEVVC